MRRLGNRKKAKKAKRASGSRIRLILVGIFLLAALFASYFMLAQNQPAPLPEGGICSDAAGSNCSMGSTASKAMPKPNVASNTGAGRTAQGQNISNSPAAPPIKENVSNSTALPILQNKSRDPSDLRSASSPAPRARDQILFEEINPAQGIPLAGRWLDLGPKIVQSGALSYPATVAALRRNGYPITDAQRQILLNGSNSTIVMNRNNSLFLLYAFWAFGLANKNAILENGPMSSNKSFIPYYASTGAWTLGNKSGGELFSNSTLITLDSRQQALVEEVAYGTYRPCCDNPTSFPDCNHGMAALGLAEWMAYQNASKDEIYSALLAANSYWFPSNYLDLNAYFNETGRSWGSISAKELLSKQYSSASGFSATRKKIEKLPGPVIIPGGCGA